MPVDLKSKEIRDPKGLHVSPELRMLRALSCISLGMHPLGIAESVPLRPPLPVKTKLIKILCFTADRAERTKAICWGHGVMVGHVFQPTYRRLKLLKVKPKSYKLLHKGDNWSSVGRRLIVEAWFLILVCFLHIQLPGSGFLCLPSLVYLTPLPGVSGIVRAGKNLIKSHRFQPAQGNSEPKPIPTSLLLLFFPPHFLERFTSPSPCVIDC